jgi:ADP-heptose:LPS heptosyltransferase
MNVLVLQLKRIGDLVLTTPVLTALTKLGAKITLVVDAPCASLLPAIPGIHEALAFSRKGTNTAVWRRIRERQWDVCLDFTGSDRSALMGWLSRTPRRIAFHWVRKRLLRRLAYHEFVDSPVRLAHTCDHHLDLLRPLGYTPRETEARPTLTIPPAVHEAAQEILRKAGISTPSVILHPGTARPEKYWLPERWSAVIAALKTKGLSPYITSGPDPFELAHAAKIHGAPILRPPDLLTLAALVQTATLVISCDTAVVHLASAFERPQIAIFGPTNPFHWRPRHAKALVISAAQPAAPLTRFLPKMKGAPTERIPASTVIDSIERLLASPSSSEGSS